MKIFPNMSCVVREVRVTYVKTCISYLISLLERSQSRWFFLSYQRLKDLADKMYD